MKQIIKADKLIPFLNQKNNVDLKYDKNGLIERKELIFNKVESINEEEGSVMCTISTQNVDRIGDIVIAKGCKVEEFKRIPSVYLNHDYSQLPIATCEELTWTENSIQAKVKFVLSVDYIKDILELVKSGALRGVSIGFNANEVVLKGTKSFEDMCKSLNMDSETYTKTRRIIKEWNMFEFSIVSIPANAECMVKSLKDNNLNVSDELKNVLEQVKEEVKENIVETPTIAPVKEEIKEIVKEEIEGTEDNAEEDNWKIFINSGMAKEKGITVADVSKEEFELGIEIENEHGDCKIANEKIVLDHLAEDGKYYSKYVKFMEETEEVEENDEKSVKDDLVTVKAEVVEPVKRFINVIRTQEDINNIIEKSVEARLRGKTRLEIKIK